MTLKEFKQKVSDLGLNIDDRSDEGIQFVLDYFKDSDEGIQSWLYDSTEFEDKEDLLSLVDEEAKEEAMEKIKSIYTYVHHLPNGHIVIVY